ncbi:enoyl-CoA hydratase/isomerase family protein [Janibacter cremeus]|uniref:Enoyl-CoA hydratase/carnithine racemase n=1 Tax=Janibacter cremeus TaxID=1285192 RepID=A0A852VNB0_9MICO|nr:enoyl-CoA hydratase-related protein [Janibacter cremeus]NYF96940.1 enoyl-CoA hydratase/carnithine racemase [Janibacter cremeus]
MTEDRVRDTAVRVDSSGPVVRITLDGPEQLNALGPTTVPELIRVLEEAGADEQVRAVVLTGEGRAFCVGANLAPGAIGDAQAAMDAAGRLITTITDLDVPVIVAANGPAVGFGAAILAAADLAVAAESAYVLLTFTAIGLVPDGGTTYTLPSTVGRALAGEMALTGRRLSADEALASGLVSRVVPDADLAATAGALADEVLARPRRAVALSKHALNAHSAAPLAAALEHETRAQVELLASEEFAERTERFRAARGR